MPTNGTPKMSGNIIPVKEDDIEKYIPHPEMTQMQARAIGKFAESSVLELSERQQEILHQPVPVDQILTRPDGMIYLDWGWYANVLDQAFGTGHWSLTPAPWNPKLYREGNITYREYVMWVDGKFAANAIGHHEETRKTANFGDAAEATYANALTRCCKRLGIARDLWRKMEIIKLKKQMQSGTKPAPPETIEVAKHATGAESVSPSLSSSIPPDSAPIFQFAVAEEYKEAIRNVQTLEALKVVWENIYKHRESIPPATFEILKDLKDSRKKVLQ